MAVPELAWYLRMRMGWGTGSSPTSVPCCKNLRISDSSVRPLQRDRSGTSLACPIGTPKTAAAQSISLKHRHREGIRRTRSLASKITSPLLRLWCFQLYFTSFPLEALQIQTLPTSQSSLHSAQPLRSKNLLTCQCRSSPPEGPAPVKAAWLSAGEALTSKTSPVSMKAHREISALIQCFFYSYLPYLYNKWGLQKSGRWWMNWVHNSNTINPGALALWAMQWN